MKDRCIFGHTFGTVLKKQFFNEYEYEKAIETKTKAGRKMRGYKLKPKLRHSKLEFVRDGIVVSIYRPFDFICKKRVSKVNIDYSDISSVEIKVIGNNNLDNYSKVYKVYFYNYNNEEMFYFNFGTKDNQYIDQEFELLQALLLANQVECKVIDETYFA